MTLTRRDVWPTEVITNTVIRARPQKNYLSKPVSCITSVDISCEFRFIDVEGKSGAPNAGKSDESFKSTPRSTDIRTHFTDVNWRENKRAGKRAPGTRSRREENSGGDKAPAVAECHGERLREWGQRDNCHKRKYIIL